MVGRRSGLGVQRVDFHAEGPVFEPPKAGTLFPTLAGIGAYPSGLAVAGPVWSRQIAA
jgi:hypothetical protein